MVFVMLLCAIYGILILFNIYIDIIINIRTSGLSLVTHVTPCSLSIRIAL